MVKTKLEKFIEQVRHHDGNYWFHHDDDDEFALDVAEQTHPLKNFSELFDNSFYGYVEQGYTYADALHIQEIQLDKVLSL